MMRAYLKKWLDGVWIWNLLKSDKNKTSMKSLMAVTWCKHPWVDISVLECSPAMMMSPNGNIFRVTGPLCGEFTTQRPVTRSFDVFFDLRLNKRLSKQPWGWWFETPSLSLWRHCNGEDFFGWPSLHRDIYSLKRRRLAGKCVPIINP